jgi:galactose mutarotase-like enzyme
MNTKYTISNLFFSCTINQLGAEISSLKSINTGGEFIWQADPDIWAGSSPILFPVVGRLKGGKYQVEGKEYSMPIHGFIKEQSFKLIEQTDTSVILRSCSNQTTLKYYPFHYQFDVIFSLRENSLTVTYEVTNCDTKDLYFAIGSHPAFALDPKELASGQCNLIFSAQESELCHLIKNDLLSLNKYPVNIPNKTLLLTTDLFENDALIFRDISSSSITLSNSSGPRLSLEVGANKHLGIWAKPNAPYVCIEPWTTTDESIRTPVELKDKPDMLCLNPGGKSTNFYRINIF